MSRTFWRQIAVGASSKVHVRIFPCRSLSFKLRSTFCEHEQKCHVFLSWLNAKVRPLQFEYCVLFPGRKHASASVFQRRYRKTAGSASILPSKRENEQTHEAFFPPGNQPWTEFLTWNRGECGRRRINLWKVSLPISLFLNIFLFSPNVTTEKRRIHFTGNRGEKMVIDRCKLSSLLCNLWVGGRAWRHACYIIPHQMLANCPGPIGAVRDERAIISKNVSLNGPRWIMALRPLLLPRWRQFAWVWVWLQILRTGQNTPHFRWKWRTN